MGSRTDPGASYEAVAQQTCAFIGTRLPRLKSFVMSKVQLAMLAVFAIGALVRFAQATPGGDACDEDARLLIEHATSPQTLLDFDSARPGSPCLKIARERLQALLDDVNAEGAFPAPRLVPTVRIHPGDF